MNRAILIGGAAGAAIGAVGYDLEIIVQGQASVWNYILFACGVAGLLALLAYRRRLIGSPGALLPPAPTPPDMRVRIRRFLAVLADKAALFLCHTDRCPVAQPIGFNAPAQGQ